MKRLLIVLGCCVITAACEGSNPTAPSRVTVANTLPPVSAPLPQPFMQRNELGWGISRRARVDTKQHQPTRVEPCIDVLQIAQRMNEEPSDDEKDERKRDLENHQALAES